MWIRNKIGSVSTGSMDADPGSPNLPHTQQKLEVSFFEESWCPLWRIGRASMKIYELIKKDICSV
jgi:hypothetical protein